MTETVASASASSSSKMSVFDIISEIATRARIGLPRLDSEFSTSDSLVFSFGPPHFRITRFFEERSQQRIMEKFPGDPLRDPSNDEQLTIAAELLKKNANVILTCVEASGKCHVRTMSRSESRGIGLDRLHLRLLNESAVPTAGAGVTVIDLTSEADDLADELEREHCHLRRTLNKLQRPRI